MSRFGDCCHYDEGYDDAVRDGKVRPKPEVVADAIRWYARGLDARMETELADSLRDAADELQRDPAFYRWLDKIEALDAVAA